MSGTKKKYEKWARWVRRGSKSAGTGEKRTKANIWKRELCEMNEQKEMSPAQQRTCNHSESSIFPSHLKRELTIIIQLTTGDPITSI